MQPARRDALRLRLAIITAKNPSVSATRRWITVACALIAAVGFALSVQALAWWRIGGDVEIGTTTSRHCFGGDACQRTGLGWTTGGDDWVSAGAATYAGGLLAALLLVTLAGALTARSSGRLPAMSAAVTTACVAVVGTLFVVNRPSLTGLESAFGPLVLAASVVASALAVGSTLWRPR